jgi:hypothetical protein
LIKMKRLIATAVAVLCLAAPVAASPTQHLGLALTVGQWLIKNSNRVYYIQVEARGRTEEEARRNGFALAVGQAIGTLILVERESTQQGLTKNEIASYSSGYVDNFKIINSRTDAGNTVLTMDVWVSHSAIATRVLGKSETAGRVEGGRISAQLQTLQHERTSADQVLRLVLADFPRKAFVVEMDKTRVLHDRNRIGQLEVAFYLSWDKRYIESMAEAVTAINQRSDCGGLIGCRDVASRVDVERAGFGSTAQAWFNDKVADQMIRREMIQSQPTIRMAIVDTAGKEQFKQCFYAKELDHRDHSAWYYVNQDYDKVAINGKAVKRFNTYIDLSRLPAASLDQVNISIVRGPNC